AAASIPNPEMPAQLLTGIGPVKCNMYIGSSHNVYDSSHPKFHELRGVFFARLGRTYFPVYQQDIPLWMLEGSATLMQLLTERAIVKGWVTPGEFAADGVDGHTNNEAVFIDSDDKVELIGHVSSDATMDIDLGELSNEEINMVEAYDVEVWVWLSEDIFPSTFNVTVKLEK
ncbi:hypothetical protein V5O48_012544, partial [Marasmius crinis-equi]